MNENDKLIMSTESFLYFAGPFDLNKDGFYYIGDTVVHQGSLYISEVGNNTNEPSVGEFWSLMVHKNLERSSCCTDKVEVIDQGIEGVDGIEDGYILGLGIIIPVIVFVLWFILGFLRFLDLRKIERQKLERQN
jgi:hypothetical protein